VSTSGNVYFVCDICIDVQSGVNVTTNHRSITLPVTYGDSHAVEGQLYVPKRGMKCALWWQRTLESGKHLYLCCYRWVLNVHIVCSN